MSISNVIVKSPAIVDKSGFLYKSDIPDTDSSTSKALLYSKSLPVSGKVAPSGSKYLLNTDSTSYFSIPLPEQLSDGKVSLIAKDDKLKLYVFDANVSGAADEYTFTLGAAGDGGATLDSSEPKQLSALEISKIEAEANKDIDGNGAIGGQINKATSGDNKGILDAEGGLFRMKVAGETVFVVGKGLDKSSSINGDKVALRNAGDNGGVWTPAGDYDSYAAVSSKNDQGKVSWTVYATNSEGVFKYEFDTENKLKGDPEQPVAVDAYNLAKDEASFDRDLNLDQTFGVRVQTSAIDAKGGLWKASILNSDFYVVDTSAALKGLKTGVAGTSAIDLSGSLLDAEGNAWAPSSDYKITSILKTSAKDALPADVTYSVYAVKQTVTGGTTSLDKNDVVRFDFALAADEVNFKVTTESADGVAVTATELAKAEKDSVRDLNNDNVFGVKVNTKALDATGGLFFANSMGSDYLLVGKALSSGPSKGLDLSSALLTSDGSSWMPENLTPPTATAPSGNNSAKSALDNASTQWANKLNIVAVKNADVTTGYNVFVKENDSTFSKYHFAIDEDDNNAIKLDENGRQELTIDQLVTEEVNTKRNLNFDEGFGVIISSAVDAKAGLYKASIGSFTDVYIKSESKLSSGSKAPGSAVDLSKALRSSDGEVWQPASEFTVTGAYTNSESKYVVIASKGTGNTLELQKYTFDPSDNNKLIDDESGDLSVIGLAALEKDANKDLNVDGIKGVKLVTTAAKDKIGGLYRMEGAGEQQFWVQDTSQTNIKDLSKALLNADGTAWDIGGGASLTNIVIKAVDDTFEVVTMTGAGSNVKYKSYQFDDNYTLNADESDVELSLIDLAKKESDLTRDINGDKVIGAKINSIIDATGKLYDSKIDGQLMVSIASSTVPTNKVTNLDDVLKAADGTTPWAVDAGFKLTAAKTTDDGFVVYAYNNTTEKVKQYNFNDERVFVDSEELSASGVIEAEAGLTDADGLGRDISGDKVVGLKIQPAVDKAGALYKASVLGAEYYVVGTPGTTLASGKDNATAVDLSRALLNSDGTAWSKAEGFEVAGLLKTGTSDDIVYNVFSYKKNGSEIVEVTQTTWDKDFNYLDSVVADPANLTSLEKDARRDLTGDGFVGFKVMSTGGNSNYKGVTAAKVFGDKIFYLAGTVKQGTANAALSLKDALLNEDGSPWNPDTGFNIKSVDTVGTDRFVYATKIGEDGKTTVNRYTFNKDNGQYTGDSKEMTDLEMAAVEVERKKDLNGDSQGVIGVGFTLSDQPLNEKGKTFGINKVQMNGSDYFIINKTLAAGKTSLAGVLLDADGQAWVKPTSFKMTGIWDPNTASDKHVEIYGKDLDTSELKRYSFSKNDNGSYTVDEPTEAKPTVITKFDFAKAEATALKDLNDDGKIGLKVDENFALFNHVSTGVSLALGAAKFQDSDRVYIVGNSSDTKISKMGATSGLIANNNALKFTETVDGSETVSYWKPDTGYEIKSILASVADSLTVYAKKDGSPPTYINYVFNKEDGGWLLSTEDSGTTEETLSSDEMAHLEVATNTKKDLTGDGVVGLSVSSTQAVAGLKKATIDSEEYYLVGANVASGTKTKPTDFAKVLMQPDGVAPWKPSEGEEITAWAAASTYTGEDKPDTAAFIATVNQTKVYFDADYKLIAG